MPRNVNDHLRSGKSSSSADDVNVDMDADVDVRVSNIKEDENADKVSTISFYNRNQSLFCSLCYLTTHVMFYLLLFCIGDEG